MEAVSLSFYLRSLAIKKITRIKTHDTNGNTKKINAVFVPAMVIKPLYAIKETIVTTGINQYKSCGVITVLMKATLFAIKSATNGDSTQTVNSTIKIIDFWLLAALNIKYSEPLAPANNVIKIIACNRFGFDVLLSAIIFYAKLVFFCGWHTNDREI